MNQFSLPREGGLIEKDLPKGILHGRERIPTEIYADAAEASRDIANEIIAAIRAHDASGSGEPFKLGLSTGRTPSTVYKFLVEECCRGKVSFANVQIFAIEEYYPAREFEAMSCKTRMHKELVDQVDIKPENVFILDGDTPQARVSEYCAGFDSKARGLDMLVIGIGLHGQV